MSPDYVYRCVVVEWHDGDTVTVDIDLGFRLTRRDAVRLYGVNAPELHGPSRAQGEAARDFAASLAPSGAALLIRSHKPERPEEKYGRWLAEIRLPDGSDLATRLIAAGHAVPYDGGKRVP